MSKPLIAVVIALPLFGACMKQGSTAKSTTGPQSSSVSSTERAEAPPPLAAPSSELLNDGQILEVLAALNNGEIEQAKVALQRAKNPRVREFADRMLRQHASLLSKGMSMSEQTKVASADSALAERLAYEAREFVDSLNAATDSELDMLYVTAEAGEHKDICDVVRTRLMPVVNGAELKKLVAENLATIQEHVREARRVEQELGLRERASGSENQ